MNIENVAGTTYSVFLNERRKISLGPKITEEKLGGKLSFGDSVREGVGWSVGALNFLTFFVFVAPLSHSVIKNECIAPLSYRPLS